METENSIKYETSYGHCRCCLEEGYHRDITKIYQNRGLREVYADIFLDCFNVFLSTNMNLSTLICLSCVERLRSARDFKKLVLKTEENLMDALQNCNNEQMVLVNVPVSTESLDTTIGFKIHMCEHEEPEINVNVSKVQDALTDPLEDSRARCGSDSESERKTQSSSEKRDLKKHRKSELRLGEKPALIYNTATLLENCNATLFKSKMRSGFPCFYCRQIFENFKVLRHHQMEKHTRNTIGKVLKTYSAESLVVYADVTSLQCTLCDLPSPNLKELKSHLVRIHGKKFYAKVTDRVVPYKLLDNYYECQICVFKFETFGAIERHMNTHYRNYVCQVCGSGYVTMLRLKTHEYSMHKEGFYPCEYCDKVFTTQLRQKCHVDFVHKMLKKLKCQKCPARFSDYFVQKKHMVEVHGELPIVYSCNVCSKSFNRRYTLSCHMKRHLEQKDVGCSLCTYTCYNNTELREHMLKHNKDMERMFRCTVCDKTYSRKKTLKEHMRIHADDRRFVCRVCDQSFVQSNSLKTHVRNHHKDYLSD